MSRSPRKPRNELEKMRIYLLLLGAETATGDPDYFRLPDHAIRVRLIRQSMDNNLIRIYASPSKVGITWTKASMNFVYSKRAIKWINKLTDLSVENNSNTEGNKS